MPPRTENEILREGAAKSRRSGEDDEEAGPTRSGGRITWATGLNAPPQAPTLKIPSPKEREKGVPIHAVTEEGKDYDDDDGDSIELDTFKNAGPAERGRRPSIDGPNALQRVVSGAFVLGGESSTMARRSRSRSRRPSTSTAAFDSLPQLSDQVTIGRNSNFHNLTPRDREELGGVEYRSLKLLLKITLGALVDLSFVLTYLHSSRLLLWPSSSRRPLSCTVDRQRAGQVQRISCFARPGQRMVVSAIHYGTLLFEFK